MALSELNYKLGDSNNSSSLEIGFSCGKLIPGISQIFALAEHDNVAGEWFKCFSTPKLSNIGSNLTRRKFNYNYRV